ncbi:MAG: hypothetical protein RLZZ384_1038 [Pseudomonadota bacterium]|jgi:hypothetical protein
MEEMIMMDISITTPALLFPAITILFLAYSNRFLTIATRIREKHDVFSKTKSPIAQKQIESFRTRIRLILAMELFAVLGIIHCTVAMGFVFFEMQHQGNIAFALSIVFIIFSLIASIGELLLSTKALNIEIEDME